MSVRNKELIVYRKLNDEKLFQDMCEFLEQWQEDPDSFRQGRERREQLYGILHGLIDLADSRALVRQERWQEVKVMIHTAQLVMLLAFILLAIDQVGIYGFLFVWLFIAVMAAAIALLLLGLIRKVRGKRSGIIFAVAICIVLCAAWFIFLFSTYGFGQGPVPN